MVERVYRSTKHPKLPDTFARLRAEPEVPKTINHIQTWIDQTAPVPPTPPPKSTCDQSLSPSVLPLPSGSTRQLRSSGLKFKGVDALPLQPTHGNRPPHPHPHPTHISRKRKMQDSSDSNPRRSERSRKIVSSVPADNVTNVKGNEDVAMKASHRQRRAANKINEEDKAFEDTMGDARPLTFRNPKPGGGRLPRGIKSKDAVYGEGLLKPSLVPSTPSKTTSSRSKSSGSPSKGLIVVNKRERMDFMVPAINFRTLRDTNESGDLKGKLQKLWQHMNWREQKVIPFAFKVRLMCRPLTLSQLILTW